MFTALPIQKIMVTDDDADERELFIEAMSTISASVSVETAQDGEELMYYLTTSEALPDLIFPDLNMPKKGGMECLMEIEDHDHLHKLPIIVYSTAQNPRHVEEAFWYGAIGFLHKPNSFSELTNTLCRLLASVEVTTYKKERLVFNTRHALMKHE